MRKLKLQVQITVDGFVGGPDGDLDWRTWDWDDKLKAFAYPLRDVSDTILLGGKMAETFIPHFEETVTKASEYSIYSSNDRNSRRSAPPPMPAVFQY